MVILMLSKKKGRVCDVVECVYLNGDVENLKPVQSAPVLALSAASAPTPPYPDGSVATSHPLEPFDGRARPDDVPLAMFDCRAGARTYLRDTVASADHAHRSLLRPSKHISATSSLYEAAVGHGLVRLTGLIRKAMFAGLPCRRQGGGIEPVLDICDIISHQPQQDSQSTTLHARSEADEKTSMNMAMERESKDGRPCVEQARPKRNTCLMGSGLPRLQAR